MFPTFPLMVKTFQDFQHTLQLTLVSLYMGAIFHHQQCYSLGSRGSYLLSDLTPESNVFVLYQIFFIWCASIGTCLTNCLLVFILFGSRQLLQKRQFFHSHRAQVSKTNHLFPCNFRACVRILWNLGCIQLLLLLYYFCLLSDSIPMKLLNAYSCY